MWQGPSEVLFGHDEFGQFLDYLAFVRLSHQTDIVPEEIVVMCRHPDDRYNFLYLFAEVVNLSKSIGQLFVAMPSLAERTANFSRNHTTDRIVQKDVDVVSFQNYVPENRHSNITSAEFLSADFFHDVLPPVIFYYIFVVHFILYHFFQ